MAVFRLYCRYCPIKSEDYLYVYEYLRKTLNGVHIMSNVSPLLKASPYDGVNDVINIIAQAVTGPVRERRDVRGSKTTTHQNTRIRKP